MNISFSAVPSPAPVGSTGSFSSNTPPPSELSSSLPDARLFSSNLPSAVPRAIFLDSGDVINDSSIRGPQWIKMVGQFAPTTPLGGPGELWGKANGVIAHKLFIEGVWYELLSQWPSHKVLDRMYNLLWAREGAKYVNDAILQARGFLGKGTKAQVGVTTVVAVEAAVSVDYGNVPLVELPEDEDDIILISIMVHLYCLAHARAEYPGAVEAIKTLKMEQGFDMFTCSGEQSTDLTLTFRTLGLGTVGDKMDKNLERIRGIIKQYETRFPGYGAVDDVLGVVDSEHQPAPVFTQIYGPDLIDVHKDSTRFYEAIFKDCGVDPREAVVVDDKEKMLSWAKVLGARTVMISNLDRTGKEMLVPVQDPDDKSKVKMVPAVDHQLGSLAELPLLTAHWKEKLLAQSPSSVTAT